MSITLEQRYSKLETFPHYYENESYVFLGPASLTAEDACFDCFKKTVEFNDSHFYLSLTRDYETDHYNQLVEEIVKGSDCSDFKNTVYILNKADLSITIKKIYINPSCPSCSQIYIPYDFHEHYQEKTPLNDDGRVMPFSEICSVLQNNMNYLVDLDTGVGKKLYRDAESDLVPMYGIESFFGNTHFNSYGRSKGIVNSKYSAVLEMIERFSSMVPHFKKKIFSSFQSLIEKGIDTVDPRELILPNSSIKWEQRSKFNIEREYYWTEAYRLNDLKKVLIPEQVAYYNNQVLRKEERFIYETSNGTALGKTLKESILYGLFEAIERDHFLVHWYSKKLPRLVDIESIQNQDVKQLIQFLDFSGYETYLFDITLETNITAIWVLCRSKNKENYLHIYNAAGCHYDPEKAIFAGLVEAATSVIVYNKKLKNEIEHIEHLINNPTNVREMEDHVNYYALFQNEGNFHYLFKNLPFMEKVSVMDMRPDFELSYDSILQKISEHHPNIYVIDMSNPLTEHLNLKVSKVIVPTLQTMTFGMQNERINQSRLEKFGGSLEDVQLRKEPHPFP